MKSAEENGGKKIRSGKLTRLALSFLFSHHSPAFLENSANRRLIKTNVRTICQLQQLADNKQNIVLP